MEEVVLANGLIFYSTENVGMSAMLKKREEQPDGI